MFAFQEDSSLMECCLRGNVDLDTLPNNVGSRPARIYISCTEDLVQLKTKILNEEWPILRDYCRESYGIELQILDLHIGKESYMIRSGKEWVEFCKQQLRYCMEQSRMVIFLAIIGDLDSEDRILPTEIEKDCFEPFIHRLQANQRNTSMMTDWYKLDDMKGRYIFKPDEACDVEEWAKIQNEIKSLLLEENPKLTSSVVEEELHLIGLMDIAPNESITMIFKDSFRYFQENFEKQSSTNILASTFHDEVKRSVDAAMASDDVSLTEDELFTEVYNHWKLAKHISKHFTGREQALQSIAEYILGPSDQAIIVHGETGQGKSSLLSYAASLAAGWLSKTNRAYRPTVVLRLCNTTASSSTFSRLIRSITEQYVQTMYKKNNNLPVGSRATEEFLSEVFQNGDCSSLFVVFLDGIDELQAPEETLKFLNWLPNRLASNIKVILSCSSGDNETMNHLKRKLTDPSNYIQLKSFTIVECLTLFSKLLSQTGKNLTIQQWKMVEEEFENCQLPLYVFMVYSISRNWNSTHSEVNLPRSVEELVKQKLEEMEKKHGSNMVSNVLAYLCAVPSGMTECEIEDLITLNDDILGECFSKCESKLNRCPSAAWLLLKNDLDDFFVETHQAGRCLIRFAHRQIAEVSRLKYLKDRSAKINIHGQISDYFMGSWGDIRETPYRCAKLKNGKSCRTTKLIPDQPLVHGTLTGSFRLNCRKLDLLPNSLQKSGRYAEIRKYVFFSFQWIYFKLLAFSVQDVVADFHMTKDPEVTLISEILEISEKTLEIDPKLLAIELTGRLLSYYQTIPNIKSLVDQADKSDLCPFIANWTIYSPLASTLENIVNLQSMRTSTVGFCIVETRGRVLATQKLATDRHMQVRDILEDRKCPDVVLTSGSIIFPSPDGNLVNVFKENLLRTYNLESGDLKSEISYGAGNLSSTAISKNYFAFGFEKSPGPVVVNITQGKLICRLPYQCSALAIHPNETFFSCNFGTSVALHGLPELERKATAEGADLALKTTFARSAHANKLYSLHSDHTFQSVTFNLTQHKGKSKTICNDVELKDFLVSNSDKWILLRLLHSLQLVNSSSEKIVHKIQMEPANVFVRQQIFVDATFSNDDDLIFGICDKFLGVWDVKSANLIRLLMTSDLPMIKLMPLSSCNKILTMTANFDLQIWNLDQIHSPTRYNKLSTMCRVEKLVAATKGCRFLWSGAKSVNIIVGNLESGKVEHVLMHPDSGHHNMHIESMKISDSGNFAVTRAADRDGDISKTRDILWNLKSGTILKTTAECQHVVLAPDDSKVIFFCPATNDTNNPLSDNRFYIHIGCMNDSGSQNDTVTTLGRIIGKPVVTSTGACTAFLQIDPQTEKPTLCLLSLDDQKYNLQHITASDLLPGSPGANMVDMISTTSGNSLVIFLNVMFCSSVALIFDVTSNSIIQRMDFMNSFAEPIIASPNASRFIDSQMKIFNLSSNDHEKVLNVTSSLENMCFVMDGRYLVAIDEGGTILKLVDTLDGNTIGWMAVHGIATAIANCMDEQTLVVGCEDGRTMSITISIDSESRFKLIRNLPSRRIDLNNQSNDSLENDLQIARVSIL